MFSVAFDKFKMYTNIEEIVLANLKKTASETYQHRRSEIVEKHCKLVYEQFYENEKKRKKIFDYGLALKPMPKSFREKIMQWPESGGASGSCSTTHKPTQSIKKKSGEEVPSCGTSKNRNEHSNKPIAKKSNHPLKEKSEHDHPPVHKLSAKTRNSLQKENISNIQNKLPETVQPEITNFFAAISLKPKNNTEFVEKQKVLKRKSDSPKATSDVYPKSKRSKDFQHINLDNEQKNTKSKPESRQGKVLPKPTTNNRGKIDSKKPESKCKQKKSSEDLRGDDSIIETSEIELDPTVSASEDKTLHDKTFTIRKKPKPKSRQKKSSDDPKSYNAIIKSPLPKRNRNEDNRKPLIEKLNQEEQTSATLCFQDHILQQTQETKPPTTQHQHQRAPRTPESYFNVPESIAISTTNGKCSSCGAHKTKSHNFYPHNIDPTLLHPDVIVDTDNISESSSRSTKSKRKTSTPTDGDSTNYELIEYLKRRERRDEEMFKRMEEREKRLLNLLERTVIANECLPGTKKRSE